MATFKELKDRIEVILDRDDIDTEINQAVLDAVSHYKAQRWWGDEASTTFSTVADQETYPISAIASDYGGYVYSLRIDVGNGNLDQMVRWTDDQINDDSAGPNTTGTPGHFSIFDEAFRLHPIPNQVLTCYLKYNAILTELSGDSDTNFWTTSAYELIRQRSLADLRIDLLREPIAIQEQAQAPQDFLSLREWTAYQALRKENSLRTASGRNRPRLA